jgi:hemoglobin
MTDIQSREDLYLIVKSFYIKLLNDSSINYLFTEVAKIDLEPHLNELVNFWDDLIFDKNNYRKNVLQIHQDVNQKSPFSSIHFEVWLKYFNQSIDENFSGSNAEQMKTRALSIATVMQIKFKK